MTIVLGKVNLLLSHPSSHANPHAYWVFTFVTIPATTKGTKANGMNKRKTPVNNIRFKSGLLCSPEHSKVCFQPL